MKFTPLFEFDAKPFSGSVVVYAMRWDSKTYIGSSRNLESRICWWRWARRGAAPTEVAVLCTTTTEKRAKAERAAILRFATLEPLGHNSTRSGKGGHDTMTLEARVLLGKRMRESEAAQAYWERKRGVSLPAATAAAARANRGRKQTAEHIARRFTTIAENRRKASNV